MWAKTGTYYASSRKFVFLVNVDVKDVDVGGVLMVSQQQNNEQQTIALEVNRKCGI